MWKIKFTIKTIIYIFIFIVVFFEKIQASQKIACQTKLEKSSIGNFEFESEDRLFFKNFISFSQLILECNQTYHLSKTVIFLPRYEILIDQSFKIENIFKQDQINKIKIIMFMYINGIDIQLTSFASKSNIVLGIYYSKLDAYSNGERISFTDCNLNTYNNSNSFFNSIGSLKLTQVKYPLYLCPFLFGESKLVEIIFEDITNSFLTRNRLNFNEVKDNDISMQHLTVLKLKIINEYLTTANLNKGLFKKISILTLCGVLISIQEDLFKEFRFLKYIDFQIDNFKQFFHESQNKWMNHLNFYVNVNLTDLKGLKKANYDKMIVIKFQHLKNFVSFTPIYDYPNEDICLFKDFPHERLVYPVIIPGIRLECTCTLIWLQKYYHIYKSEINDGIDYESNYRDVLYSFIFEINSTFNYCSNQNLDCNFGNNFKKCKKDSARNFSDSNDTNILFLIKWFQFILLIILQPLVCSLGIVNNFLTILVVRNKKKKKEFNHSIYKLIQINCLFNILYCMVIAFNLMNSCVFYTSSVFCSSVYQMDSVQTAKIILIKFLGNALKMCSNFSYLSFSISRLVLISRQKENKPHTKFSNLIFTVYFFVLLVLSCVLSIFRLFQFRINFEKGYRKDFPFEFRNEEFCKKQMNNFECKLFNSFKISNHFLNDILCVFVNLMVDLILMKKFKKHLKNKSIHIVDTDQRMNIQKRKKNLNRMVLVNSFIYILSHLPEFATTLMLIVFSKKISRFCDTNLSCDLINEEAEVFCLISIVFQFFIFRFYDKNFKASFLEIKSAFLAWISDIFCIKRNFENNTTTQSLELTNLRNLIGNGLID